MFETLAYPICLRANIMPEPSDKEPDQSSLKNIQQTQGAPSMNRHEQSTRFADKSTKATREIIEGGIRSAEEATNGAKLNFLSSLTDMRELNIKLIDMAHANVDAVFYLAHEVASVQTPSDFIGIWSAHAKRQFEMMTKQTKELTELGQKLASPNTGPGLSLVKG
jgi:hypothetical protein